MNAIRYASLCLLVLVLVISGCAENETVTVQPTDPQPGGYPVGNSEPSANTAETSAVGYPAPNGTLPGQEEIVNPGEPSEPAIDKASVSGVIFSFTTNRTIPGTLFYLTPAVGENLDQLSPGIVGPIDENGDIRGFTNELGQFDLVGIPPGNYFLIVSAPYNWAIGAVSPEDETPRLIELNKGDRLELGTVYVSWP